MNPKYPIGTLVYEASKELGVVKAIEMVEKAKPANTIYYRIHWCKYPDYYDHESYSEWFLEALVRNYIHNTKD